MTEPRGPGRRPARGGGPDRRLVLVGVAFAAVMALGVVIVLTGRPDEPVEPEVGPNGFTYGTGECPPEEPPDEPVRQFADAPRRCIEAGVDYAAVLTTDRGEVTIDLLEADAPGTVNNFVVLARWRYFEGAPFHRVIPGFVVQGGDPVGEPPGTGGPGYTIPDELPGPDAFEEGSVAMANQFDPTTGEGADTGGSQFFVVTGPQGAALGPYWSRFGRVVEGMDVVGAIEQLGSATGEPEELVTISRVAVVER